MKAPHWLTHLQKRDDEEVEVGDAAELLKQVDRQKRQRCVL